MARRIRWSATAFDDFEKAAEYIARSSEDNSAKFVGKILDRVETLIISGEHHGVVPELNDENIHEALSDRYRLIYKIVPREIRVLGLIHGSRDLLALWIAEQR
jgi:plasmid stabilization system protein ParE